MVLCVAEHTAKTVLNDFHCYSYLAYVSSCNWVSRLSVCLLGSPQTLSPECLCVRICVCINTKVCVCVCVDRPTLLLALRLNDWFSGCLFLRSRYAFMSALARGVLCRLNCAHLNWRAVFLEPALSQHAERAITRLGLLWSKSLPQR